MKVAIVGRSNVGKSSIFNKLCGQNLSIVFDEENTTSDYISCNLGSIILSDTIGLSTIKEFKSLCGEFILENDLILFAIDGTVGFQATDRELIRFLHRKEKKIWLIINKCDVKNQNVKLSYNFEKTFSVSATHNIGLDVIADSLNIEKQEKTLPLVAIVGRSNSGKSTLMNAMLNKNRSKISEKIGTTRDSIYEEISTNHNDFLFIDTAGYRDDREHLEAITSRIRYNTLKKCAGAIVLIDGEIGMTKLDKKIISEILLLCNFMIIAINKCDNFNIEAMRTLNKTSMIPNYFPMIEISAYKGFKIKYLLNLVDICFFNSEKKVSTNQLNTWIQTLSLKDTNNATLKVKYITQLKADNNIKLKYFSKFPLNKDSEKYLKKKFCEKFEIVGSVIRLQWSKPDGQHSDEIR